MKQYQYRGSYLRENPTAGDVIAKAEEINRMKEQGLSNAEIGNELRMNGQCLTSILRFYKDHQGWIEASQSIDEGEAVEPFYIVAYPYFAKLSHRYLKQLHNDLIVIWPSFSAMKGNEPDSFEWIEDSIGLAREYPPTSYRIVATLHLFCEVANDSSRYSEDIVLTELDAIFNLKSRREMESSCNRHVQYSILVLEKLRKYTCDNYKDLDELARDGWGECELTRYEFRMLREKLREKHRKDELERQQSITEKKNNSSVATATRKQSFLNRIQVEEQLKASQEQKKREQEEIERVEKERIRLNSIAVLTPVDLQYKRLGYNKYSETSTHVTYLGPETKIELDLNIDADRVSKLIYYQTLRYAKILESRDGSRLNRSSKLSVMKELFRLIKLISKL